MKTTTITAIILSFSILVACDSNQCLPSNWDKKEIIEACAKIENSQPVETRILAWKTTEFTNNGLYIEECLIWHHQISNGKHWWWISSLYRHPKDKNYKPEWRIHHIFDAPNPNFQTYDHPPTGAEIAKELFKYHGFFSAQQDIKIIDAQICQNEWIAATGKTSGVCYSNGNFSIRPQP